MKRLIKSAMRKVVQPLIEDDLPEFDQQISNMFATPSLYKPWIAKRDEILSECSRLIDQCKPLMPHQYRHLLTNIATNICRFTWPFAASEDHHHHHMGGLPIHSCETMLTALKIFREQYTPEGVARALAEEGEPVRYMLANKQYERVGFSIALAALAHDLGKMFDQTIAIGRPGIYYYAMSSLPEVWLAKNNVSIEKAYIAWHVEREAHRHAVSSVGILLHLLTPHMNNPEYAQFIAAFMSERAFPLDMSSPTVPLKNFPKIATYLHLTNLAILHHNNLNYHDPDNFVLNILRRADSDSTEEWENKNAISLVDFIRRFLTEQFGSTVRANAAADLTIYVRKSGRYILVPRKRFYDVFLAYLETFGKTLNVKEEMFARELTRHRIAVPVDDKENRFEPLTFTIRVPPLSQSYFDTLVLDTVTLGIEFDTEHPALGIYFLGSNAKDEGTLGLFQFTKPYGELKRKKEKGHEETQDYAMMEQDDSISTEVYGQVNSTDAPSNVVGQPKDEDVPDSRQTDDVHHELIRSVTKEQDGIETKIDGATEDADTPSITTVLEDDFTEVASVGEDTNDARLDQNIDYMSLQELMAADLYEPDSRSALIETIVNLAGENRLRINDRSMTNSVFALANEPYVYARIKEVCQTEPEIGPLFRMEIEYVVACQAEGKKDDFGRRIGIFNLKSKGKNGKVMSDYLIRFPKWKGIAAPKGGGAFEIALHMELTNASELLEYCGL